MPDKKEKKVSRTSSLSAKKIQVKELTIDEVAEKIFSQVNQKELEKSLDKWLKENDVHNSIATRDLGLLKSIVAEYLDAFIVFGYTLDGERVILQNYQKARDRDAIMEFFKTIFIKQQQENFLD